MLVRARRRQYPTSNTRKYGFNQNRLKVYIQKLRFYTEDVSIITNANGVSIKSPS